MDATGAPVGFFFTSDWSTVFVPSMNCFLQVLANATDGGMAFGTVGAAALYYATSDCNGTGYAGVSSYCVNGPQTSVDGLVIRVKQPLVPHVFLPAANRDPLNSYVCTAQAAGLPFPLYEYEEVALPPAPPAPLSFGMQ